MPWIAYYLCRDETIERGSHSVASNLLISSETSQSFGDPARRNAMARNATLTDRIIERIAHLEEVADVGELAQALS